MRAFVVTGPGQAEVQDVPPPQLTAGQVIVDVELAGVCGTDAEFFSGHMSYLATGHAAYPLRIGHEWCGRVSEVGPGVDPSWLGRRVSGDTMLGCGACRLCVGGRQHLCEDRYEIGIRGGWPGALAEQLPVPASALVALPTTVDEVAGALIEPSANALRAVRGAQIRPGSRLLVVGPGAIGLLSALIARAAGAEVSIAGQTPESLLFASTLGFDQVSTREHVDRAKGFDAVIDASNGPEVPALAAELVDPGGRVVFIGLAAGPSRVDTRSLVLKDVTAVGFVRIGGPGGCGRPVRAGPGGSAAAGRGDRSAGGGGGGAGRAPAGKCRAGPEDPRGPPTLITHDGDPRGTGKVCMITNGFGSSFFLRS